MALLKTDKPCRKRKRKRQLVWCLRQSFIDLKARAETVSELVKSEADGNAFDRRVRERVYDDLYKASGGLT